MQEYAEFQYRRRHRQQRRRGDVHSLLGNPPDPDEPSESTLGKLWSWLRFSLFFLLNLFLKLANLNVGEIGMPGWLSSWASAFGSGRDPGVLG